MRRTLGLPLLAAGLVFGSACTTTNYYDEYPEGTVVNTVPAGYAALAIGGITYWMWHDHYYRYWPGYGYVVVRPPHGRPPYHRPPHRPPGHRPKPEHPIERPPGGGRPPGERPKPTPLPSRPSIQPTHPSTRPSMPSTRPSMPSTRPSMPSTRPSMPSARPARMPSARPARMR